ncbi:universal stress protein [Dechloromonas sp. A34]|uniref:universal stress protein n=1 Tax=Dechloromonas sp. A34 TaxID=447588 RepID=UPI0022497D6C|nr:universal stress protein [Dechloromonas sp. A34]
MYKHLLVPLDGSGLATEIVSRVVPFALALGARITFFTARADYAATGQGALQRTVAPEAYADNLAGEARGLLQKAEAAAKARGVPCATLIRNSDRPAAAILAAAEELGCDLIFMASHGHKGLRGLVQGSQTQKVLAGTALPVLVATIESNQPDREKQAALAIIQDEHRSLAAVVRGLLHLVDEAVAGRTAFDVTLARTMIHYIESFPERLHHPKEDAYLFRLLSARTADFDAAIAQLRTQHADGDGLIRAMQQAIDRHVRDGAAGGGSLAAVATAVNAFAEAQWEHMNLEENTILPAACQHLTDEDWAAIHAAFSANGDPRFDADLDDGFKRLYTRIANLVPQPGL